MYFRLLHDERSGAVSYLLADLDAGEAVLVDPRGKDIPVLNAIVDEHQLRLRWLLSTHEHDAPWTDEAAALDALGAPRIQHRLPAAERQGETATGPRHAVLTFGNEHVQVLRTPGHTPGRLSCTQTMTSAYALTIELPQPLAAAIDTLRAATDNAEIQAACEAATAALQRGVARRAQGVASPAASAT